MKSTSRSDRSIISGRFVAMLILLLSILAGIGGAVLAQNEDQLRLARDNGSFVELDGVLLYYEMMGDAANPPILLLHGFGGSTFTWRYLMPDLADAGYYVVAVDLPPFGLSDKNPDLTYSREWMAQQVMKLSGDLELDQPIVIGHSMGGLVTAYIGVEYADSVRALVFVAGGVSPMGGLESSDNESEGNDNSSIDNSNIDDGDTDDGNADGPTGSNPVQALLANLDPSSPLAGILLERFVTRDFFADTLKSAYHDPSQVTDEAVAGYAEILEVDGATSGFLGYLQAIEQNPITLADLDAAIADKPVLLIWGEVDSWVTIDIGYAMQQTLDNARMITYPEIGHIPMEENTKEFNRDIIGFIDEQFTAADE